MTSIFDLFLGENVLKSGMYMKYMSIFRLFLTTK